MRTTTHTVICSPPLLVWRPNTHRRVKSGAEIKGKTWIHQIKRWAVNEDLKLAWRVSFTTLWFRLLPQISWLVIQQHDINRWQVHKKFVSSGNWQDHHYLQWTVTLACLAAWSFTNIHHNLTICTLSILKVLIYQKGQQFLLSYDKYLIILFKINMSKQQVEWICI